MSPGQEFWKGMRAELPLLVGVVPFGLIYGVVALAAGLPPSLALAMSALVFAGSAQLIGAELIGAATPGPVVVLTTLVVNLRHMLYSASVAPHVRHLPRAWKVLLAYLLTDEAYAVTSLHYRTPGDARYRHWFFLGAGLTLWGAWQASSAAGILLARTVPPGWGLDFSLALTFIGIVIPALRGRAELAAALTAAVVAVAAADLPLKLGLILAAAVGIGVGLLVEVSGQWAVESGQRQTHDPAESAGQAAREDTRRE